MKPAAQTTDRGLVDARLSLALEAGQMGTWEWELDTNRVVWSSALERIHGLEAEQFDGTFEAFQRDIHPDDRARVLDSISQALSGGDYQIEYRIIRPDLSIRWLEARGRLLCDVEGKPERLVGVCSDITERKEATLRLQLSEAFYSATLMSVADAVITTDPEGRVTLMNGVAESLSGWRLEEAKGRPFGEVIRIVADPAPSSDRFTQRATSGGAVPARVGKLLLRRDGTTIAVDDSASPIRDAHGEVVGQVVVFRDVAEERQEKARSWFIAEASALLTSTLDFDKTLRTIAELAVPRVADWCAIHALLPDGSLQRLVVAHQDSRAIDLTLLEQSERQGSNAAGLVVRTGRSVFVPEVSEAQMRAAAETDEHFETLRGRGIRSYMVVPLRGGERILGAISFVTTGPTRLDERDLQMAEELGRRAGTAMENARLYAEAQRARRAAEESAARAALIQEVTAALSEAPTPSIVAEVVTSLGTKAIGAAAAAVYELARPGEELVLVRSMGYPEDLREAYGRLPLTSKNPIVEAAKTGRAQFFRKLKELEELHVPQPQHVRSLATFESWAALPLEVEGRRLGALGISFKEGREFDETERDFIVTVSRLCAQALERANLYETAQKARAEAETSRRTRENLLAVVSHDLRNPLSAIATTASLLAKGEPGRDPSPRIVRFGANILRAAQRMDRLIIDLLDLAKIESGRLRIDPQDHDVASIVNDSVEILVPLASSKGLLLKTEDPMPDICIHCDRERILQVLSNLLGNALKFTEEGGTVTVSARECEGEARFTVADTGCGIAADQIPHIFDRYWQAKSARDGIGLGLSIAKGIVEAHRGRIWVESKIGEGTTFFFTLSKNPPPGEERSEDGAVTI